MNMKILNKYKKIYSSGEAMGAAKILRRYLDLDEDYPVPLSISHGVDMNHCSTAMDVNSVEPIHWSCNSTVYQRACSIKSSVLLPHPWLMLKEIKEKKEGAGILVIGPPPGKLNDSNLLDCLRKNGLENFDLLLKYRGDFDRSRIFWEDSGIKTVSAGSAGNDFYENLYDLLDSYEYVIGCTLSSALFFSASIGKKCKIIEGYTYVSYDTADYQIKVNFNSPVAREFLLHLKNNEYYAASDMAFNILGGNYLGNKDELRDNLLSSLGDLKCAVHHASGNGFLMRKIAELVAVLTGKTGLITHRLSDFLMSKVRPKVCIISINEVDVWLGGVNDENFKLSNIAYVKGITEPGHAVD